jgi:hypothetical protein
MVSLLLVSWVYFGLYAVTTSNIVAGYYHFGGTCCPNIQGLKSQSKYSSPWKPDILHR